MLLLAACGSGATTTAQRSSGATAAPAAQGRTLVVLGASDAYGVGTSDPDRDNWPTSLSRQLRGTIHLVNLGVPGITLGRAAAQEMPIALDAHPDVVVLWLAVNDFAANVSLATYSAQLRSAIHTLRTQTSAHVYVANLPDLTAIPYLVRLARGDQQALAARVSGWNDAIAAACAQEGATLVDLFSAWQELRGHPEYISGDGLHPSTLGAQRLAEIFRQAIEPR
ncbi:MAG TPA: SGNH/GDSL hydrolase family protein [Ktedonobacterales bacterium]